MGKQETLVYFSFMLILFSTCKQKEDTFFCLNNTQMILGESTLSQVSDKLHIIYDTENNDDSLELLGIKSYYYLDNEPVNAENSIGIFMSTLFRRDTLQSISILFHSNYNMSESILINYINKKIKCTRMKELLIVGVQKHSNATESATIEKKENKIFIKYNIRIN